VNLKKIIDRIFGNNMSVPERSAAMETLQSVLTELHVFEVIKERGFAVVPFLSPEELKPVQDKLISFNQIRTSDNEAFYTSGRDHVQARKSAKDLSWPYVAPFIGRVVKEEHTHTEGCAWLIKPPGDLGSLSPHQDSSLIDETRFASLYGWMPLQDVNEENGTIHVIPGSHRWGIHFRSLDVLWPLEGYNELLLNHSIPIEMKAGELLLFEGALIHGSGINKTNQLRAALNFFFRPKEAEMLHFMKDEATPKGKVESFKINVDFFHQHNFRERPDPSLFPFHQYYDFSTERWSEKQLKRLLSGIN
jgi:hypothetical protein